MRRLGALFFLAVIAFARPASAAPQAQASLSAGTVEAGSGVTLVVVVTEPAGSVGDPQFSLPHGITLLGSEQGQSFSWVNGRASNRIEYRYAIGTDEPGHYAVGPIRVRIGKQVFECPELSLTVTNAAPRSLPSAHSVAGASLVVEVRPQHPYVGQLVQLSMKLVQTQDLSQSGGNSTPSTTGFWAEGYGEPIESHATAGGRSAIVTERRARLYPLAPGPATIGSASLIVTPASTSADPFLGGTPERPVEIRSQPVQVEVRPLPAGAPRGFDNAVGSFTYAWGLDRGHTTQDQPLTLHLDVQGTGNLPLLHIPAVRLPDFEVYASTVNDSFAPAGEAAVGRRRFLWTLMPKRTGTLRLEPPPIAWFDPGAGAYRTAAIGALEVQVLAAGASAGADRDANAFPEVFERDEARPGGRPASPWLFALGGVLMGLAVRRFRAGRGTDSLAAERARMRELLRGVGLARGPDFWSAADEAAGWVDARGGQVKRLREDISAARYSGKPVPEDDVRRRLVERLSSVLPPEPARVPAGAVAGALAVAAIAALVLGAGGRGSEYSADRSREGDKLAKAGKFEEAGQVWAELWSGTEDDGSLMARLAWAELRLERPASAATWIMNARGSEPRSEALAWVTSRVRESGGLVGAPGAPIPLRSLEWAALAFAFALGALLEWPRRWSAAAFAVLALAATVARPLERMANPGRAWAVVSSEVALPGTDVSLDPAQVVRVLGEEGGNVRVRAARDLEGVVPDSALRRARGTGR